MNKTDLINSVAAATGQTKKATDEAITAILDAITGELARGGKVQLIGFGSFEIKNRPARTGRNPKTKEQIEIAASRAPVFKAGKALKDAVK
jgi:DNA-binding protein HU-beta